MERLKRQARESGKKFCSGCKYVYDLDAFSRNAINKDGLQTFCRDCMSGAVLAAHAKRADFYREKLRESAKRRYHATKHLIDREEASRRWRAWHARNKDYYDAYQDKWAKTTHEGWLAVTLQGLRQRSQRRGHPDPCFSATRELRSWIATTDFQRLWDAYVASGYDKWLRPSIDRLDNARPYTLDNIRLVTWRDNLDAAAEATRRRAADRRATGEAIV